MTILTKEFSNTASGYARQAFGVWINRYWWAVCLPLAIMLFAGMYNPLFFLVALMLLTIIYPGILMHLYYTWALRPDVALSLVPHTVEISEEWLIILYSEREGLPTPAPKKISTVEIAHVVDTGKSLVAVLKSSPYDMIEIPISAFPSQKDAEKAINTLSHPE